MNLAAQVRWQIARRPWLYWTAVAAVALVGAGVARDAERRAERERERWGRTVEVVVATTPLRAGAPLRDLAVRAHPIAVVPDGAVRRLPETGVVRRDVRAGQVLTEDDLAGDGPLALVPDGHVAVAVTERVPSGVRPGQRVSVTHDGLSLTDEGLAVGRHDVSVLIAVPDRVAAAVAAAAGSSSGVTLVLRP